MHFGRPRLEAPKYLGRTKGLAIYELLGMAADPGADIPGWVET